MTDVENPEVLILLQPPPVRGSISVGLTNKNVQAISAEALRSAMDTLRRVAAEVVSNIKQIHVSERPNKAELEFGLLLTTDAKAFIVNASAEAHFKVKLIWEHKLAPMDEQDQA
jgi:hypothetical protein